MVPAIGRVMQFRMLDDQSGGPFWSHPALGPGLAADENGWINFGGDKAWPAPQAAWAAMIGKGWPPPADVRRGRARGDGRRRRGRDAVAGRSGLRHARAPADLAGRARAGDVDRDHLREGAGAAGAVAVWTITQLAPPTGCSCCLPERSAFAGGHRRLMPAAPRDLAVDGRLLSLARDPREKTMIASDGDALLWVGDGRRDLMIENRSAAPATGAAWPEGAHSQIYTSPDGARGYVELELLGPLHDLAPGQSASLTSRYELRRRDLPGQAAAGEGTPVAERERRRLPPVHRVKAERARSWARASAPARARAPPGAFAAGGRAGPCFASLCLCGSGCAALRNANERSTPQSSGTTTVSGSVAVELQAQLLHAVAAGPGLAERRHADDRAVLLAHDARARRIGDDRRVHGRGRLRRGR